MSSVIDFLGSIVKVGDYVVYPVKTSTSGRSLVLAKVAGFKHRKDGNFAVLDDCRVPGISPWYVRSRLHMVRQDKIVKVSK